MLKLLSRDVWDQRYYALHCHYIFNIKTKANTEIMRILQVDCTTQQSCNNY
jgi:hypothetical protein